VAPRPSLTNILARSPKRFAKEGSWVVLGQGLSVGGSLVAVKVLTGLLTPTAYGHLALGMTAATLITQCVLGPLANGATRFYAPAMEKGALPAYLIAIRNLAVWATAGVGLLVSALVSGALFAHRSQWIQIAIAASLFALLSGYNSVLSGIQSAARQRAVVAIHQGSEPWLRLASATSLILLLGATSTMALLGSAIGSGFVLISQYAFFRRTILRQWGEQSREVIDIWRGAIWQFARPFSLWGIFTWAQLASDRWALDLFASAHEVGTYSVLFQLGYQPIALVMATVMQFLTPIFYHRVGSGDDLNRKDSTIRSGWKLSYLVVGISIVGFFLAEALHRPLFRVLVSPQYGSISYLLPWMLLASGVFAGAQFIALNLMSQMKTSSMLGVKIATSCVAVLLNVYGARTWGTPGVVGAALAFSIIYFLGLAAISVKGTREEQADRANSG
jgi:O-antigen/teichoic acid export membrane protein